MREDVCALKVAMEAEADLRANLAERKKAFEEENRVLADAINVATENTARLKNEITGLALQAYAETGEKKMFGGIGIRSPKPKELRAITDKKAALAFAKEKDMFLQLDEKAMIAAAEGLSVDFISITMTTPGPSVTFPKEIKTDE